MFWQLYNKVFNNDKTAIDESDIVVVLSYGRHSTAGTNWEAGYAFGTRKIIVVVEMTDEIMSLMVSNGCHSFIKGTKSLKTYDFDKMEKYTTNTEQK